MAESKEDKTVLEEVADVGLEAGAGALGFVLGGPAGAAAGIAAGRVARRLAERAFARRGARALGVSEVLAGKLELPAAPDEQAAALDQLMEDPSRADTIVQAYQEMLDAVSSSAWPCIASLTRDYVSENSPADGFYRDAVAVLKHSDDEGLVAIEALLSKAESQRRLIGPGKRVEINYNPGARQDFTFTAPQELRSEKYFSPAPPGVQRALRLLGAQGFGLVRGDRIQLGGEDDASHVWRLLGYVRERDPSPQKPHGPGA